MPNGEESEDYLSCRKEAERLAVLEPWRLL